MVSIRRLSKNTILIENNTCRKYEESHKLKQKWKVYESDKKYYDRQI